MRNTRQKTQRVALMGLLLSLMLILGFVESRLPVPGLPGVSWA